MTEDWINSVLHGDAVERLGDLPSNSVHVGVTSPPYFQQRDYGHDGQIGSERTIDEYVDNLVDVMEEVAHVLRDDGSFFLNLGDKYVNRERQLVPGRVAWEIRSRTPFLIRNDIIWDKEGRKPDPAGDRRGRAHEHVYHLVLSDDYWYDETVTGGGHTDVVTAPTASSSVDHLAVYSEELVEELLEGVCPGEVCGECGCPYRRKCVPIPRPFADPERTQAQRAAELYEDSELTHEHISAVQSVGISDVGKAAQTEDGAGRNTEDVQELAREAKEVLGGYYREFTMIERIPKGWEQVCDCSAESCGPIVLDPFAGSGTTLEVAKDRGHRYVGVDINEEYVELTRNAVAGAD